MKESDKIKGKLVYAGLKNTNDGSTSHCYFEIDEIGTLSTKANLYAKKLSKGAIGSIVDVHFSPDKQTCYFNKNSYPSSFYPDNNKVSTWRAESEAIELTVKRQKEIEKVAGQNPLRDKLDPIREAYFKANHKDRASLLANIIEYITR